MVGRRLILPLIGRCPLPDKFSLVHPGNSGRRRSLTLGPDNFFGCSDRKSSRTHRAIPRYTATASLLAHPLERQSFILRGILYCFILHTVALSKHQPRSYVSSSDCVRKGPQKGVDFGTSVGLRYDFEMMIQLAHGMRADNFRFCWYC